MLTFILSLIAGFATPMVEPMVTGVLKPLTKDMPIMEGEFRTITFVLLLIAVAVAAMISGSNAPSFTILLGGALGLFGMRLFNVAKAVAASRKSVDVDSDTDAK